MNIHIVEVGPRDGFQMEKVFIPTDLKVKIIDVISRTGVRKIEATSFVSPKVVPQMADAVEVMRRIERVPGVSYTALIPNLKGAQRAYDANADGIRLVLCATESYNRKNIGQTREQTLEECQRLIRFSECSGIPAEIIIALSFGCPLEGVVSRETVIDLVRKLADMGYVEISIADSIGVANPKQVRSLMEELLTRFPKNKFSLHVHDTRGLGLLNVMAAIEAGVDTFDSSIGGLGGCPIHPGTTGNISTEDLANLCTEIGMETGVDVLAVVECSRLLQEFLNHPLPSRILHAGTREQLFQRIATAAT